jgi:hypothetical protein
MIAAMVALSWDRSRLRTRSCLVVPLREPEARAAFCLVLKLRRFETLKRERDFAFDRAIGTSERGAQAFTCRLRYPHAEAEASVIRMNFMD